MKGKLFKQGQAITLTRKVGWCDALSGRPVDGPKFGEIYHVERYSEKLTPWGWFIYIKEIGIFDCYVETIFSPVISDDEFEKELSKIDLEEVKVSFNHGPFFDALVPRKMFHMKRYLQKSSTITQL